MFIQRDVSNFVYRKKISPFSLIAWIMNAKGKGKAVPQYTYGGEGGERMYSSYSLTTSALDGGEWSALRPGRALPPWKGPPVSIVQEAGWDTEPVWTQM
jgi:hypothetical protein